MTNRRLSTSKEKCAILKKTQRDVQIYKLHMNLTTSKPAHNVKSKGNVSRTKNDRILRKSVSKPNHLRESSSMVLSKLP